MDFIKLYGILPKSPQWWTIDDVCLWLEFIGLSQYQQTFRSASIDGSCICLLEDNELQNDLKIQSSIIRKKLLNWIKNGLNEYQMFMINNENIFSYKNTEIEQIKNNNINQQYKRKSNILSQNNTDIVEPTITIDKEKQDNSIEHMYQKTQNDDTLFSTNNINSDNNPFKTQNALVGEMQKVLFQSINTQHNPLQPQQMSSAQPKIVQDIPIIQNQFLIQQQYSQSLLLSNINESLQNNGSVSYSMLPDQEKQNEIDIQEHFKIKHPLKIQSQQIYSYDDNSIVAEENDSILDQNGQQQHQSQQQLLNEIQNQILNEPKLSKLISQKQEDYLYWQQQQNEEYELIIQPTEGLQTTFYRIKQKGGKIGRHSSNEMVILEESVSRFHANIEFYKNDFFIKDVGSTTGTFIKISQKLPLEVNNIIELGSNQFLIEKILLSINGESEYNECHLNIIEGPNQGKKILIQLKDSKEKFSIGRKASNNLQIFEDQHLSNVHAYIFFLNNEFIIEDLASTNGSWRRLSKEGEQSELNILQDQMIFKIGSTSTFIVKSKRNHDQIEQQQKNLNDCVICCEKERDALYYPCRHNTACIKCSHSLQVCPICKQKIEEIIRIYRA